MKRHGVVVLPTIIIFGTIALGIIVTGLFIVQLINRSVFGIRLAAETQAAIESTIADIHLRLVRGDITGTVSCSGGWSTPEVTTIGRVTVTAKVCHEDCGLRVCRYKARVEGKAALFIIKETEAVFDEDIVSGQINLTSATSLKF